MLPHPRDAQRCSKRGDRRDGKVMGQHDGADHLVDPDDQVLELLGPPHLLAHEMPEPDFGKGHQRHLREGEEEGKGGNNVLGTFNKCSFNSLRTSFNVGMRCNDGGQSTGQSR